MIDPEELRELNVIVRGGEYRHCLPGRGITIVRYYHPLIELITEAVAEAERWFQQALTDLLPGNE